MLANPGPQMRGEIVEGAVATAPWTDAERALEPTVQEKDKFPSLLHQRCWYAIWPLRDRLGFLENADHGYYVLTDAGRAEAERLQAEDRPERVGRPFPASRRVSDGSQESRVVVFEYDPDERDRQTRAHELLVHQLKDAILAAELEPLVPEGPGPLFDVAFYAEDGETLVVIEVKSLSDEHAVHQLRLGLGQVQHYAHRLGAERPVRAALAVPIEPGEEWREVCAAAGVTLIVADELDAAIALLSNADN